MEVDVATLDGDENKSDLIDGNLGEGSQFHETYGFYAQGVKSENRRAADRLARPLGRPRQREDATRTRAMS